MRSFFVFLTFVCLTSVSFSQENLSLQKAINIALQKNTTLQKNINTIKSLESNVLASYGSFLPNISANGSWDWNRSEDPGTTFNFGGAVFNTPPSNNESRNYSVGINSQWTLFDGLSNYATLSKSKNDLEAGKLSIERLKQDIVFQTVSFYYDVITSQQLLKVSEENLIQNQKNLETIIERNKLGSVTLADVYAQQVQAGNAELDVIKSNNTLAIAKSNLLYYLGLDVMQEFKFTETLTTEETETLNSELTISYNDISAMVQQALENRPDYKGSLLNLESAYNDITTAKSGHFPRLTNSMGFNTYANQIDNLFDQRTYSVGLTLSIPIFSGFSVSNRVQFAEVNAENTEIDLKDLERTIKQSIQQTFLNLQEAEKGLNVSEKNVKAAEENLKIEQEKYTLGAGKLLDVLVANSTYINAKTTLISAQFAFIRLSEQLKYYLGVLDYKKFE
ncbi:MAG: TolC family protein [Ignavibacteriales bacterium]|nr:TolC family protein [Ignavibacteriales bacterium]